MRKDYHIHPTVLTTPERFDAFIEAALHKNIKEICITDHMPLSISHAADRIEKGKISAYCHRVRALAEQYREKITIRCGIEIDYHPDFMDEIEAVLASGSFDYILASSHMHVFVRDFQKYTFNDFAKLAIENTIMAAQSSLFTAISHFDMYRFAFENPDRFPLINDGYSPLLHEKEIKTCLDLLHENDMYLEINPHLAETKDDIHFMYPEDVIVKWALEKDVRFSYGSDAHEPHSVGAWLDILEAHPLYGKTLKKWETDHENDKRS